MDLLTDAEFRQTAYPALHRLFVCDDPYDAPFAPDVSVRWILFPYDFVLTWSNWPLQDVILNYAQRHAEVGFYYSILGRPTADGEHSTAEGGISVYRTWFVPFTELDAYERMSEPIKNIIYSPGGRWGILCSDESHGLLGGDADLAPFLAPWTRALERQVHEFIDNWLGYHADYGAEITWLPHLLRHVYGDARAGVDHGVPSGGLRQ